MKDNIRIKIHSEVDVITNSSTTIYTQVRKGSIDTIKELVNTLLKMGGSELTADDMFTFEVVKEDISDAIKDLIIDEGILEKYIGHEIDWRTNEYREKREELYNKMLNGEYPKPHFWDYGYYEDSSELATEILVTCKTSDKDGELVAKILSNLENLFNSEERCN